MLNFSQAKSMMIPASTINRKTALVEPVALECLGDTG